MKKELAYRGFAEFALACVRGAINPSDFKYVMSVNHRLELESLFKPDTNFFRFQAHSETENEPARQMALELIRQKKVITEAGRIIIFDADDKLLSPVGFVASPQGKRIPLASDPQQDRELSALSNQMIRHSDQKIVSFESQYTKQQTLSEKFPSHAVELHPYLKVKGVDILECAQLVVAGKITNDSITEIYCDETYASGGSQDEQRQKFKQQATILTDRLARDLGSSDAAWKTAMDCHSIIMGWWDKGVIKQRLVSHDTNSNPYVDDHGCDMRFAFHTASLPSYPVIIAGADLIEKERHDIFAPAIAPAAA